MSNVMEAEDFLELLWGEREGWVDLPAKVGAYWVPYPIEWPQDLAISRRIDQSVSDGEDLYYSVAMFSERGRNIDAVMPVGWLWADLDDVHPSRATEMGFMPTFAIESSPGRYQALWKLDRLYQPKTVEKLNRALTYALGADRGGWDLTQVLRIPSTRNFKYAGAPPVRMLWANDLVYKAANVWATVKGAVPAAELARATEVVLPQRSIPHSIERLLHSKDVVRGERSDVRWKIEKSLAEAGCTDDEIYSMVVNSAWNSFAERGPTMGKRQLMREIRKAIDEVKRKVRAKKQAVKADDGGSEEPTATGWVAAGRLPRMSVSSLVTTEINEPDWMVENIWTANARGFIGGEPKTSKTLLAMALGLSVASGQPFLGEFDVVDPGPVLYIQNENSARMMQERARRLMANMGLSGKDPPMWFANNEGFELSTDAHLEILENEVADLKPKLVILDPLINMVGDIDSDKAGAIQPILNWLIRLWATYKCGVVLVHHSAKRSANASGRRAGQRLLGSTALHAFAESSMYTVHVEDPREGWSALKIEREFRSMEPQTALQMAWHFSSSTTGIEIELASQNREGLVLELIRNEGVNTIKKLEEMTELSRKVLTRIIDKNPQLKRTYGGRGGGTTVRYVGHNGASPSHD